MSLLDIVARIDAEVSETFGHLDEVEQKVVKSVAMLSQFDAKGAYEAIKNQSLTGVLHGADELLSIVGLFFPPAATAKQWIELAEKGAPALEFLAKMYAAGLVRGVDYKDPAYNAPAGPETGNLGTGA